MNNEKIEGAQQVERALDDAELEQVSGGGLLSSPLGAKLKKAQTLSWSGTPYQPEEDVEAY